MYYRLVLLTSAGIVFMWLVAMVLGLAILALGYVIAALMIEHLNATMFVASIVILVIIFGNLVAIHESKK